MVWYWFVNCVKWRKLLEQVLRTNQKTMISITIGNNTRKVPAPKSWIKQQILDRKKNGDNICVRFSIDIEGLKLDLITGQCGSSGGNGGLNRFNSDQLRLIELWRRHITNNNEVDPGEIIAFQNQLSRRL
jgi:hypothetical protein